MSLDSFNFFSKPDLKRMIKDKKMAYKPNKRSLLNFEERRRCRKGFYLLGNLSKNSGLGYAMEILKTLYYKDKFRKMSKKIYKFFLLSEIINSSYFLFELEKVKLGVKIVNSNFQRQKFYSFELMKLDYCKENNCMYKLRGNQVAKIVNLTRCFNKILLRKGLWTIKENVEIAMERKMRFDIRYKAFVKLCIYNRKRQAFKTIFKPFLRRGFDSLVRERSLSLVGDGLGDLWVTVERFLRKKYFFELVNWKGFERVKEADELLRERRSSRKRMNVGSVDGGGGNKRLRVKIEYLERLLKGNNL